MGKLRSDGFVARRSIGTTAKPDVLRTLAVDLPEFADEPVAMKASSGETLSLIPRGMRHARFRTEQGTVIAESVAESVDALWSASEDRAEIYYLLRNTTAPRTFRFDLEAEDITVETEGTIAIKHGDRVILRIPRPFAVDANGTRRDAGMRLEGKQLVVDLDTKDLAFPIVLDPGVETATWTRVAKAHFPHTGFCASEVGGKLLVFGGFRYTIGTGGITGGGVNLDETWEFDGTTWTKKLPATSPPARSYCYMGHRAGAPVLFGGRGPSTSTFNDTWTWSGTNWVQVTTAAAPTHRAGAAFVSTGTEILLYGGSPLSGSAPFGDTWTFNGSNWSPYAGTAPPPRWFSISGRTPAGVVVVGGSDPAYNPMTDTWLWSGGAWSKKADSPSPVSGWGFGDGPNFYSYWDPGTHEAFVFDGTTWANKKPAFGGPAPRYIEGLVEGATAKWMLSYAAGEGWETLQKLVSGTWVTVDRAEVPAGSLGALGGDVAVLSLQATGTGKDHRLWRRATADGTWSSSVITGSPGWSAPTALFASGSTIYAMQCGSSSFNLFQSTGTTWSSIASGPITGPTPSLVGNNALSPDTAAVLGTDVFFWGKRISGATITDTSVTGKLGVLKGTLYALDNAGAFWKWNGSAFVSATPAPPSGIAFLASSGNRLVGLRKSSPTGAYDSLAIFDGATWRTVSFSGGPTDVSAFVAAGSHFYVHTQYDTLRLPAAELWSLDIGYDLGSTCTLDADCTSGHCTDGACCPVATCGAGSSCATPSAKGSCRKLDGTACGVATECASGFCEGSVCCKTACDLATHTCSLPGKAGTCLKLLGQPATAGSECTSGIVSDGVCCNAACTGKCQSCKKSDTTIADGTCAPVSAGIDPAMECPDPADPNSCGPDGFCDGAGACRVFAPVTKTCGMATCAAGVVDGHHCNASGTCIVGTTDCAPFVCADASSCLSSCTTPTDCKASGMRCVAGACVPPSTNGTACTTGDECASKNCVDGVCCNNACDGQCQACNLAGSAGTCSAVKGDPVGGRAACNGGGTACAGTCDGVGAACTYPSFGTDCGTTCTDGKFVDKKCDNKGACVAKDPVSCNNYACETAGCKTSCSDVSDCASNTFDCKDNKCIPQATAQCAPDGIHIQQGDALTDCSPQRCKGGKCVASCIDSTLDCVPGYVCGGDGKCMPAPAEPSPPSDTCGCSTKPAPFSTSAAIALLAIATSLGRRARKRR